MPSILAIDTSSDACSAAVLAGDRLEEHYELAPRGHASRVLPFVAEVLGRCSLSYEHLDAIAYTVGPGSFTGLRVAAGVVQGLALAADKPVVPVSTLAALALSYAHEHAPANGALLMPLLDARMNEVYQGLYRWLDGRVVAVQNDRLLKPHTLSLPDSLWADAAMSEGGAGLTLFGSGLAYQSEFPAELLEKAHLGDESIHPRASSVCRLAAQAWQEGAAVKAEEAMPVYLRDEVAWKKTAEQPKQQGGTQ